MLLVLIEYIMKFVDINKLQNQRCTAATGGTCTNMSCWQHHKQHVAELRKHLSSNSSSTSSGCDSAGSMSSKENFYMHNKQQQQRQELQEQSITPQQLQQLHFYQQLQRKQLLLLQQQLLKRRQLQQQQQQRVLQQMGMRTTNKVPLNCNQQYLQQLRMQQQQQHYNLNKNDNICFNDSDVLNNNNNNNNSNANFIQNGNLFGGVGGFERNEINGFVQGQKFRRGMTEFPTKNDITQKSPLSQPLQNSSSRNHHLHQTNLNTISPQHFACNINNKILTNKNTTHTNKTLANISHKLSATPISPPTSAQHSPLHYKKPLNSPNNSPFLHAYTRATTTISQQQQQQQKLLPSVGYNNNKHNLNDILAQQQHLQQQQQQLLQITPHDTERECELSEESLKQNVAIVLNNLDRYNNALRSIILNEQVTTNSYLEDIERQDVESLLLTNSFNNNNNNNNVNNNNNFLQVSEEFIMATAATPESDYNSNATTPGSARCYDNNMLQQHTNMVGCNNGVGNSHNNSALINAGNNIGGGNNIISNNLNCSLASEHDFTHDNSDYQWFLDYGYRDGCNGMQRSVLSSLSASYNTMGDLIYYEDIAKNLDANLAEVDMESFQAQDINSLLWQLPSYCQRLASGNQRLQQSLLLQQQQQQQLQQQHQQQQQQQQYLYDHQQKLPQHVSQTSTTSTNEMIENSICKSELLFSPVKETHLSVGSLDMDNYPDDGDIILTCKANKENYTIAFEGSVLYSDDSYYEPAEITLKNKQNFINLHSNLNEVQHKALDVSMSRSEQLTNNCQNNKMQR